MVAAGILMGAGALAVTAFFVWLINRDKKKSLAKRWPPTFGVTLFGCFFGVLMLLYSLGLPTDVAGNIGNIFAGLWIIYFLAGLVGCFLAWAHPGRMERKAFRNSLAEGLPTPLPMISAQLMAIRVGVVCFLLMFVVVLVTVLSVEPNAPSGSIPFELIMIAGTYPSMAMVAAAWWIQRRRVIRRDEDYRTAQDRQLERLAQENSAAYRNGFDDGQTTAN